MMIKKTIVSSFLILNCFFSFSQESKIQTGYFDNDNTIDTICYKFIKDTVDGPFYKCQMTRGNGMKFDFSIYVGFESLQISECGKGCIDTYQWKTGIQGFEIYSTYKYKIEYDNWILEKELTVYDNWILRKDKTAYNKKRTEIYKPKDLTGIDGTEYKTNKKKKKESK